MKNFFLVTVLVLTIFSSFLTVVSVFLLFNCYNSEFKIQSWEDWTVTTAYELHSNDMDNYSVKYGVVNSEYHFDNYGSEIKVQRRIINGNKEYRAYYNHTWCPVSEVNITAKGERSSSLITKKYGFLYLGDYLYCFNM